MSFAVRRRELLPAIAAVIAARPFAARAQQPAATIKDQLVGSWLLVSVTSYFEDQTDSPSQNGPLTTVAVGKQPYGPTPKGRLTFEPGQRFTSAVVTSDGRKPASADDGAPVNFEGSSGKYEMHPSRPKTVILELDSADGSEALEEFIEIKLLTAKELAFDTSASPGGGWFSSFVYRRAE